MKKILISILIILLIILAYFSIAKGVGFLGIKSIKDIKTANNNLESNVNEANELSNKTYPTEIEGLEEAIKKLKISKQEYENKSAYNKEKDSLSAVEIKTYKIHYLWTILGNYRKNRGVQALNLDLKSTQTEDVYDLEFTLRGSYTSITDFIYDIENDEELNFDIKNFQISSQLSSLSSNGNDTVTESDNTESNSNNVLDENTENNNNDSSTAQTNSNQNTESTQSDGIILQAKFTVEDVGITLD